MKLSYINISSFTNENAKQYIAQRFAENNRKGDSEQDIQNLINKIGLTPYLLKIATSYLIENPTEEISRYIEFLNPEDKDDLLWVTIENIDLEAVAIAWVLVRLDPTCLEKDFLIEKVFGKKGEEMLEELVKFSIISPTIKEGICVGYEIHKEVHRMLKEYFKIDPAIHEDLEEYQSENMLAKAVDAVSEIINIEYSKETDLDYIRIYINHAEQITHDTHTDGIKILSLYEKIVKFYEYSTQNAKERNINHNNLRDHEKTLEFQLKALDIWSKILPENHPDFAVKYVNIGVQYYQLEDKEKSIIYFKWAYKICSQSQCCDISRSTDWIKKLEPQCDTTCLEQSTCLVGDIQQLNDMASG